MATTTTRRRATLHIPENPDTNEFPLTAEQARGQLFEEPEEPEQTDVDRVAEMMRAAGNVGRAVVKVYKIDSGASVFCDEYSPAEFEDGGYSMLRAAFGAGKFKIMLYGEHPQTARFGILAREQVTIAENRAPANHITQPDNGMTQILAGIAKGQEQMLQALIEVKQAPPVDPMAQMTQMLSMMTMMRTAMGLDGQSGQKSTIGEIVAAVRELREVAGEITPGAREDGDSLTAMLPQVLDVIKTGMAAQRPAPTAIPQITLPQSLQSASSAAESQSTPEGQDDMNPMAILKLRGYMSQLIDMAVKGESPDAGAALIFEKLPDDFIELMALPNWFDALKLVSNGVEPHQVWLTEARDKALAMFEAPDQFDFPAGDESKPLDSKPE